MKYFMRFFYFLILYILPINVVYAVDLIEVYNIAVKNDPELSVDEDKQNTTMQDYKI